MKATLLAILTLGSLAMADQAVTLVTYSKDVTSTSVQCKAGDYDDVVFTLSNDASRFRALEGGELTSTVTLSSLMIAAESDTAISDKSVIITDASGLVLAFSTEPVEHVKKHGGTIWGDDGLDYTRWFITWDSFFTADFGTALTLNLDTQYKVFFATFDQVSDLANLLMGVPSGLVDPVNVYEYTGEKALNTTVRLATIGEYDAGTVAEYTFEKAGTLNALKWAPYMAVTVLNSNVPEPTTGTLSLLALAGLCIRRRK